MCLRVSVKVPVGGTGMGPFAAVEEAAGHRAAGGAQGTGLAEGVISGSAPKAGTPGHAARPEATLRG